MRNQHKIWKGVVVLLGLLAAPGMSQSPMTWSKLAVAGRRASPGCAFDSARGRLVIFGGYELSRTDETWEWDGSRFEVRLPQTIPPKRTLHAMAYDRARHRTVLFGGAVAGGAGQDTWEWDGTNWTPILPATVPPAFVEPKLAYDITRARTVLVGEYGGFMQVWEYDGSNWFQRASTTRAPGRMSYAVAYDEARAVTVMFGGKSGVDFDDTWAWDGKELAQLAPAVKPVPRSQHSMAYDAGRGRIVLFGGTHASIWLNDTWEWDGANWANVVTPISPSGRLQASLSYDTAKLRVLLFGGSSFFQKLEGDVWSYDGRDWARLSAAASPHPRSYASMAWDDAHGKLIMFGGDGPIGNPNPNEMWEWHADAWSERLVATPPVRARQSIAFDSVRRRLVYCGSTYGSSQANTWEWDDVAWIDRSLGAGSPLLENLEMVYDSRRSKTIAFGDVNSAFQTWEWDGVTWVRRSTTTVPTMSRLFTLCFDSARGRTVLFTSSSNVTATWEYDGLDWVKRVSQHTPSGQYSGRLVFDASRRRSVLIRTEGVGTTPVSAYEWDGTDWDMRAPATSPAVGDNFACGFEKSVGAILLFGGTLQGGTWRYAHSNPAYLSRFGLGCSGAQGRPTLELGGDSLPYAGNALTLRAGNLPPGAPASMLWGLSRTSYFGLFPLPFDLSAIGMAGCSLLVQDDLSIGLVNVGGSALWIQGLCDCPEIIGSKFYNQVVTLDPAANLLGFIVSNGTESFIARK